VNIAAVQINTTSSNPKQGDNLTIIRYLTPQSEIDALTEQKYDGLYQGNISALPDSACQGEYGDIWTNNATILCTGNDNRQIFDKDP
jgi:hypothetical protein